MVVAGSAPAVRTHAPAPGHCGFPENRVLSQAKISGGTAILLDLRFSPRVISPRRTTDQPDYNTRRAG